MIYFIRPKGLAVVKIGVTNNIKKRLAGMQTASPCILELVLALEGERETEKALHQKFAEYRIRGEWFRLEGAVVDFVSEGHKSFAPLTPGQHLQCVLVRARQKASEAPPEAEVQAAKLKQKQDAHRRRAASMASVMQKMKARVFF